MTARHRILVYSAKGICSLQGWKLILSPAGDKRGPRYSVYDICHPGNPQEVPRRSLPFSKYYPVSNADRKPHEVEFIRCEGGFEALPHESVSDEILHCYFHHVHFLLPVVNAAEFLNEYHANGFRNINPLLIWSMFLAAANVSTLSCHVSFD